MLACMGGINNEEQIRSPSDSAKAASRDQENILTSHKLSQAAKFAYIAYMVVEWLHQVHVSLASDLDLFCQAIVLELCHCKQHWSQAPQHVTREGRSCVGMDPV